MFPKVKFDKYLIANSCVYINPEFSIVGLKYSIYNFDLSSSKLYNIYSSISLSLSIPKALNNINNGICFFILGNLTVKISLAFPILTTVVLAYLNESDGIDLICAE